MAVLWSSVISFVPAPLYTSQRQGIASTPNERLTTCGVTTLSLVTSVMAQSQYLLPSNPGGAIPAGVEAPSISGFMGSTVHPSRGGLAVRVSGMVPVKASTSENWKFNYGLPQNQSQVTETFVDFITKGSTFTEAIMVGKER